MPATQLIKVLRARALSSDARAGSWSRNKARREQHHFIYANWPRLLLATSVMLVSVLLVVAVMPTDFSRGMALGGGLASIIGLLTVLVLQVTGTAPAMMGGQGEQWTASELRPLQRQGWKVVHHVSLRAWDIDHVLIGPGGAFAIETKWSAQSWASESGRVARAASQAAGNARDLSRWAPFRKAGIDVQPLVMLWGGGGRSSDAAKEIRQLNGVVVVPGQSAGKWRKDLPSDVLTHEQIEAGWLALDAQVRVRDERELEPVLPSVERLVWLTLSTVSAAALGVVTAAWLLSLAGALWAWVPLCAAAVLLPLPLRKHDVGRFPVLGWQAGVVGTVVVAGLAGGLSLVL